MNLVNMDNDIKFNCKNYYFNTTYMVLEKNEFLSSIEIIASSCLIDQ
jgi:hypothetical protein